MSRMTRGPSERPDPRGTVYGGEDASDFHAESREYDPETGHYADTPQQRSGSKDSVDQKHACVDCGREIPRQWERCEPCAKRADDPTNRPWLQDRPSTTSDEPTWTYSRVVVAIVEAATEYHARALGRAAFRLADSDALTRPRPGLDVHEAEVEPLAEFAVPPAKHLTTEWDLTPNGGGHVEIASVDSEVGQAVLATAIEQTGFGDGAEGAVLFTEDGTAITDSSELSALEAAIDESDEGFWVAPGIVSRYA